MNDKSAQISIDEQYEAMLDEVLDLKMQKLALLDEKRRRAKADGERRVDTGGQQGLQSDSELLIPPPSDRLPMSAAVLYVMKFYPKHLWTRQELVDAVVPFLATSSDDPGNSIYGAIGYIFKKGYIEKKKRRDGQQAYVLKS